jgi:hypothetical protein
VPASGGAAVSFSGIVSPLQPDDPRLQAGGERSRSLVVLTSALPATRPRTGEHLTATAAATTHRIVDTDHDSASGLSTIIITP